MKKVKKLHINNNQIDRFADQLANVFFNQIIEKTIKKENNKQIYGRKKNDTY